MKRTDNGHLKGVQASIEAHARSSKPITPMARGKRFVVDNRGVVYLARDLGARTA